MATDKPEKISETNSSSDLEAVNDEGSRGEWGSSVEFLLTCVGYAVGLGNVWRFPYLAYDNGGGAFLLPYVIMLFLCGIPVFFMELSFGQFASLGPVACWAINPVFKGIGVACVIVTIVVDLSYHIVIAYILYFFFASMTSELPWADCNNDWNTVNCLTVNQVKDKNFTEWYLAEHNMTAEDIATPSEEFYYNEVLKISGSINEPGTIVWQLALTLAIAWLVDMMVLIKGISSMGKVVYFTSTFPYLMMTVMVVRGCTLDGAWQGLEFYLVPDWDRLSDAKVWGDAASQIFYSLGACSGSLIAMASYNDFKHNVFRDAMTIPFINCGTSMYAGLAIFSVLGFMAQSKGVEINDVAASGPGLIFVVYPEGLAQMPAAPVWAFLFFLMMLVLGFSSSFSSLETVFISIMDEFPFLRKTPERAFAFRATSMVTFYLISLPMVTNGGFYIFSMIDYFAGSFPRLFLGVFEIIAIMYVYGITRFSEDIALMIGRKPGPVFSILWTTITPIIVVGIIVMQTINHRSLAFAGVLYPEWTDLFGWIFVACIVGVFPLYAISLWFRTGFVQVIIASTRPSEDWRPAKPVHRTGIYAMDKEHDMACALGGEVMIGKSGAQLVAPSPGLFEETNNYSLSTSDIFTINEAESSQDTSSMTNGVVNPSFNL